MAKITIKDNSGSPQASFTASADESIGTQAQDNGAPVPFSCGVGACRTCVGRVTKGMEHLNQEAVGPKHIDTEDDEVLLCICGVNDGLADDVEIEIEAENL